MTAIVDQHGNPMTRRGASGDTRQLDAAGTGHRWSKAPFLHSFANEAIQGGMLIRSRAKYFARNNPNIVSAVDSLVANIVGNGIRPQPRHPDPDVRERLGDLWEDWQERADVTGCHDFYGLQALAVRQMVEAGEAFCRYLVRDGALRLQLLSPDQLPFDDHRRVDGGGLVRAGVEVDADGAPVGFHFRRARPGDVHSPVEVARIPAADVAHVFNQLEPGQPRGVTWLLPILLTMLDFDAYEDATLVRQKVAAMAAGAVIDMNGEQTGVTGRGDGFAEAEWGPGTLFRLDPGQDIRWFNPPDTGNHAEFTKHKLRMIAVGIGATYELISGDYGEHNYSSLRASYIELRRRVRQIQHGPITHQLLRPTWRRFIDHLALSGEIDLADLQARPRAYSAEWLAPRFEAADPLKDIKAELAEIRAGLKSRSQAARERGISVEELDRQIAEDRAREQRLGLAFDASDSPAGAPATTTGDSDT